VGEIGSHVAHIAENRNAYRVLVGKPEGRRPLGTPINKCEDNIKWIARKQDGRALTGFSCLKFGQVTGFCEHGNGPSGSVKCKDCPN
jgi:hypothetical protein